MYKNVAIIGASSLIARAIIHQIHCDCPNVKIIAFSRKEIKIDVENTNFYRINYDDEASIKHSANVASKNGPLDLIFVANGILHDNVIKPEKSIRDFDFANFEKIFKVNTIIPAMIAKYFMPLLNKEQRSIFAFLSARVGSISDNKLGGWYAYRSSKSALNMIIKNLAIESGRTNKKAIFLGLHPGTVDSPLSKPFQKSIAQEKIFTPEISAMKLLKVIENASPEDTGCTFAWDGKFIKP